MKNKQTFDDFYFKIYNERWPVLKNSLLSEDHIQVARLNSFINLDKYKNKISFSAPSMNCLPISELKEFKEIPRSEEGLLEYYILDPASVLCAELLNITPGQKILDMCAAPGGKALILAQKLFSEYNDNSEIILNELSQNRRERLTKVIQQYIPKDIRQQLWIKGQDGALFCTKNKNSFDRILLDAPCSGEKHLLANPDELSHWLPKRTEKLALQQYSLLSGALLALKTGGEMIYSTCSISSLENDMVIEKLLKKKGDWFEMIPLENLKAELSNFFSDSEIANWAEFTKYGVIFLPDKCNFGPLYITKLRRTSSDN